MYVGDQADAEHGAAVRARRDRLEDGRLELCKVLHRASAAIDAESEEVVWYRANESSALRLSMLPLLSMSALSCAHVRRLTVVLFTRGVRPAGIGRVFCMLPVAVL